MGLSVKVGDLVEYKPNTVAIPRHGVILEDWHMDGKTQYLIYWNERDTATKKIKWYAAPEQLRLVCGA
tara:strand:+ start:200 stop:403 length:204 start_codon:yes stop_codon:yes gene_type:complete